MRLFTLIGMGFLISVYLNAQDTSSAAEELENGIIEHLDSYLPDDIRLISENGDTVLTGQLFGKPIVHNLVYFRCPGICTPFIDGTGL